MLVLIVGALGFVEHAYAAKPVSGLITSDSTWSLSDSPIQLAGPTAVMAGVTLTIEPGVTVNFGNYYLQVNGTLHASGTSDNKIVLTTDATAQTPLQQIQFMNTSSDCIVKNAVLNQISIVARDCSPQIANNVFNNPFWMAVLSTGGSASVSGNVIQGQTTEGISVSGSSTVTDNLLNLTRGDNSPTAIVAHGNAYVGNNKILNFYNGITVDGQVTVKGNVIVQCSNIGVWCTSAYVNVQDNYIANNNIGISAGGNIQENTLINNEIAIQTQSITTTITNNNIFGSSQHSVVLTSAQNLDVTNNWWGTTDTQAINQTIWDFKNDFNLGTANFFNYLTAPNPQAPTSADSDISDIPIGTQPPTQAPTLHPMQPAQPTPTQAPPLSVGDSQSGNNTGFQFNLSWIAVIVVAVVAVVSVAVFIFSVDKQYKKRKS
jgi:hypothetical protein